MGAECLGRNNTSAAQELSGGKSISYIYTTDRLLPSNSNEFSVALYHVEDNKLKKRIGWLTQKIPVVVDAVKPVWLASSSSSSEPGTLYVQALDYVNLYAHDEFGRIDAASFKTGVAGSLVSGESFNQDVTSKFLKLKVGDGWQYVFSADVNPLAEGLYNLNANVKDLALNAAETKTINFRIDRTAPSIAWSIPADALTNQLTYQVPVKIDDLSPTTTKIYVNEELQLTTPSTFFTATLNLTKEGANSVKVVSTDAAGNVSISETKKIVRDTTPPGGIDTTNPSLLSLFPKNGSSISGVVFQVGGTANEKISSVSVNGLNIAIGSDGKSFRGSYVAVALGIQSLSWIIKDLAGNTKAITTTVNLEDKLLVKPLVSVMNDPADKDYFLIVGQVGAARPGATVKASEGFFSFNRAEGTVGTDGSFEIKLRTFSFATLTVRDSNTGQEESMELTFKRATRLSGVIKNTDNAPLPNVTAWIDGDSKCRDRI